MGFLFIISGYNQYIPNNLDHGWWQVLCNIHLQVWWDGVGGGGGVIGWQASSSNYVSHDLSGQADNNKIGCLYSDDHSAIIYRICMCKTLTNHATFISLTTLMSSIEITLNQPKTHNNYCVSVTSMSIKT